MRKKGVNKTGQFYFSRNRYRKEVGALGRLTIIQDRPLWKTIINETEFYVKSIGYEDVTTIIREIMHNNQWDKCHLYSNSWDWIAILLKLFAFYFTYLILTHLLKQYGLFEKWFLKITCLFLLTLCRFKDRSSLINYCASLINSWSVSPIIVFDSRFGSLSQLSSATPLSQKSPLNETLKAQSCIIGRYF